MLSKILTAALYALTIAGTATASQRPLRPASLAEPRYHPLTIGYGQGAYLTSGFYAIHNKAYDGQLAAFHKDETLLVLHNETAPKIPILGKLVQRRSRAGVFPNEDDFIVTGNSDILFNVEDAGDNSFVISQTSEDEEKEINIGPFTRTVRTKDEYSEVVQMTSSGNSGPGRNERPLV
ncbi:hypothetical protein B0H17DRAFT_1143612 [Mycena rosella]|uniref:Uncharacterized protein n=1 Tax=Mycena rosella TaxID=1033263 RepID=A0AAD7CUM3_MYCRO|nr:hypothetical protein B0H17DRAFT_1143612 [Mycena rosella]